MVALLPKAEYIFTILYFILQNSFFRLRIALPQQVCPHFSFTISKGFAKQSRSFTMEWLCEAKPTNHNGKGFAKQSQSINSKGFAKQSPSIMMERLCEAKPLHHKGLTLRSKTKQSKQFGIAKQIQFYNLKRLCEAKPIPSRWKGFAKQSKNHLN